MNVNQTTGSTMNSATIESRSNIKSPQKLDLAVPIEAIAKQVTKGQMEVSPAALKDSVDEINRFINASNGINLHIDHDSGKVVVQIVDKETNVVLRQIPSAEVLSMAKDLDGKKGLLVKDQA